MQYFKYYLRRNPCSAVLTFLCVLLIIIMLIWPKNPVLMAFSIILGIECLLVTFAAPKKRLNDYLIMVRYPLTRCFWIFQNVKRPKRSGPLSREAYLSQMRQALEQLPPGTYKTITQSMFTREIRHAPNTVIIKTERAYKKSMNPIVREIYGNAFRPSKFSKQFYYVEFKRI